MALSPVYAAILQDLNKAVAQSQPEDVLQFCSNWFNAKLEEQRIAGRLSIAQAESAMGGHSGLGSRSKSLAPLGGAGAAAMPHQVSGMKKKASLPSLAGQGYTFGSPANGNSTGGAKGHAAFFPASNPSPFSEAPPMHITSRGGPSTTSRGAGTLSPNPADAPARGGIQWNRPFSGAPGPDVDMHESDEDNARAYAGLGGREDRHGAVSPSTLPPHRSAQASTSGPSTSSPDNGIPSGYNLGRRTSVSAESIDPNSLSSASPMPKVVIAKTPSQRARIESSTEKNLLFRNLDEEQHNDVVNAMKEVRVTKGTEVIVQGAVGDFFYVVESGDFQVWVKPQQASGMVMSPTGPSNGARGRSVSVEPEGSVKDNETTILEDGSQVRGDGSKLVASISSGGSFGELALMYNAPRAATVVCSSDEATLWALDRVTFRTILMEHTSKKRRMYEKFLSEVPILVSLENYERSKIADALEERIYEEGEDVVREAELGKNFYIIESGTAEVLKRKEGGKQERVGTLSKGDYFGELALLNSAPRAATVRTMPGSGRLRVATLGEKAFTRLLGPVVEILTRSAVTKYGPSSVASGERDRGGASAHGPKEIRHDRERSGTSTPTAAANRDKENA